MQNRKNMVKVIIKHPAQLIGNYRMIDNELEAFQKIVSGYIEVISPPGYQGVKIICNEEGKLKKLRPNFQLADNGIVIDQIVGPVVICGEDGEEFADVPITLDEWHKMLWDWGNP